MILALLVGLVVRPEVVLPGLAWVFGTGMLATVIGLTMVHRLLRRLRRRVPRWARPPQPVAAPRDWAATARRFEQLRAEYAAYECDALEVLRLPALADVTVPATGRFVDAFAAAQALHTEAEPPAEYAASYRHAVEHAWRCWRAAREAAERIRLAGLPAEERTTVQRLIKLLTMARDSGNDAERLAAYAKARTELARLDRAGRLHVPRPALASLDAAARASLPAPAPARDDIPEVTRSYQV